MVIPFCGFVFPLAAPGWCAGGHRPPNDRATGLPFTDKNNPDPKKRDRPLLGVQILMSMQSDGPGKWTGQIYNDDNGKLYRGHLIELNPSTIRIEGCWMFICDGEELARLE